LYLESSGQQGFLLNLIGRQHFFLIFFFFGQIASNMHSDGSLRRRFLHFFFAGQHFRASFAIVSFFTTLKNARLIRNNMYNLDKGFIA